MVAGPAWEAAAFPSGDVVLRRGPGAGLVLLESAKVKAVVGAVTLAKKSEALDWAGD